MTLPGIAGIVPTMGMAVDSNVIIFERVREPTGAIGGPVDGFGFPPGVGNSGRRKRHHSDRSRHSVLPRLRPDRGFAVTLGIGIITTVFTAYTLTRWVVAVWLRRARPKAMPIGVVRLVPDGTRVPFMRGRRYAFGFSLAASLATVVLFATLDMNYGIDFRGGSSIEVQSKGPEADPGDIRRG